MKYAVVEKGVGETPLHALEAFRAQHQEFSEVPLTYAGRLDPMAEGKMLILIGDECKNQDSYRGLDKEYEIEVLLDAGSDTGDALGLAAYSGYETRVDPKNLSKILARETGAHKRAYPAYSSKTVDGKPVFLHALQGTLKAISIPEHIEFIHRITYQGSYALSRVELEAGIERFLALVPKDASGSKELGRDFRITEVRESWKAFFASVPERSFTALRLRVVCGSGAYMRTLAERVGESLGTKALALRINRTHIGKYWMGMWISEFK